MVDSVVAVPKNIPARINAHFTLGGLAVAAAAMACAGWIWVNHDWPDPPLLSSLPTDHAPPRFVPAVLDINRIFAAYPKTRESETAIKALRAGAKAEMDRQLSVRQQWLDLVNGTSRRLDQAGLSDAERRDQSNERDRFILRVRASERELTAFKTSRERELNGEATRLRRDILDEISSVADAIARRRGITMLFDAGGQSTNGVTVILAAPGVPDLTDEVIAALVPQTRER